MPRMDGTGPLGQGPMTGRGLGPCNTNAVDPAQPGAQQPGNWFGRFFQGALGGFGLGAWCARRGGGMGAGRGRGMGRGRRGGF